MAIVPRDRLSFGSKELDKMVGGGLLRGTATLISGAPGVGKTTLGLQFLIAGIKAGQPGLLVSFEEFPASLIRDAKQLGWDLNQLEKEIDKEYTCISIPHSENWYYSTKINSSFVVPAMSGIPLINGIPPKYYNEEGVNFSIILNPYQNNQKLLIENENNIYNTAKMLGYSRLIEYKNINNKLNKKIVDLK